MLSMSYPLDHGLDINGKHRSLAKEWQPFDQNHKRRRAMQPLKVLLTLMFGMIVISCGGGTTAETDQNTSDLSSQEQAELVAAALSADQGGVGDDLAMVTQAVSGDLQQQARKPSANYGYNVSVNIDFYDEQDNPQQAYDPDTTDRIAYQSVIQGEITNGTGFFSELRIDNRSDFTVDSILSRMAWINGIHTNQSAYSRTQVLTQAQVHFQLDCELMLTEITVDLDAADAFPESGTIEGTVTGSYERVAPAGTQTHQFTFHFMATYLGDNTAEVELADGTIFIVQLANGAVENLE
jgi:hypothetical protein